MSWATVFSGVFKVAALRSTVCEPDGAGLDDVKNFIGSTTSKRVQFVVQSGGQARDGDLNTTVSGILLDAVASRSFSTYFIFKPNKLVAELKVI